MDAQKVRARSNGRLLSVALDEFDLCILNSIQGNSRVTSEALSKTVPLSASAITRRIRRLRKSGVIAAEVALLAPKLFETWLRASITVQLKKHGDPGAVTKIRQLLTSRHEVQACLEVSGTFDLLLLVVCRDMTEYTDFADLILGENPLVERYQTSFIKKEWKNSRSVRLRNTDFAGF